MFENKILPANNEAAAVGIFDAADSIEHPRRAQTTLAVRVIAEVILLDFAYLFPQRAGGFDPAAIIPPVFGTGFFDAAALGKLYDIYLSKRKNELKV